MKLGRLADEVLIVRHSSLEIYNLLQQVLLVGHKKSREEFSIIQR